MPRRAPCSRTARVASSTGPSTTARPGRQRRRRARHEDARRGPAVHGLAGHEGGAQPCGGERAGHPEAGRPRVGRDQPAMTEHLGVVAGDERWHQRRSGRRPAGLGDGGQPVAQRGHVGELPRLSPPLRQRPEEFGGDAAVREVLPQPAGGFRLVQPDRRARGRPPGAHRARSRALASRQSPSGGGCASGTPPWHPRCSGPRASRRRPAPGGLRRHVGAPRQVRPARRRGAPPRCHRRGAVRALGSRRRSAARRGCRLGAPKRDRH